MGWAGFITGKSYGRAPASPGLDVLPGHGAAHRMEVIRLRDKSVYFEDEY